MLAELRSSECEYVERLRIVTEVSEFIYTCILVIFCITIQDYLRYIQTEPTVPADLKADVLAIFCNLPDIYAFHKE